MKTGVTITKTFKSGNSQAVRIPSEMQLPYGDVEILEQGNGILIRPLQQRSAAALFDIVGDEESDIQRPEFNFQERDFGA